MINRNKLTALDRVMLDLEVLDQLKSTAQELPESGRDLLSLSQTFNAIRYALENNVRVLLKEIQPAMKELDILRQLTSEIDALRLELQTARDDNRALLERLG